MLDYSQIRARDFNPATGVIEHENTSFRNFEHRTHAGGVNLNGLFDTGSISHNLLLGIDLKEEMRRRPVSALSSGGINNLILYNLQFGRATRTTDYTKTDGQYQRIRSIGGYAQDNINLTENLIYALGLRYEYYDQIGGNLNKNGGGLEVKTDSSDGKFIYQTGLIYLLTPEWSVYGNYAQSFRPQISTSEDMGHLDPEEGISTEVGTKFQNDEITATLALFNIDKKNVAYSINNVTYATLRAR